jgi:hypothetical protein
VLFVTTSDMFLFEGFRLDRHGLFRRDVLGAFVPVAIGSRALDYARGWHISGVLRLWAGEPDIAIEHIGTSLRLSPRARVGSSFLIIGRRAFLQPAL